MAKQIYLILLIYLIETGADLEPKPTNVKPKDPPAKSAESIIHLAPVNTIVNITSNQTISSSEKPVTQVNVKSKNPEEVAPQVESGAVIRGVLVFVGISVVFILYLAYKTCRKRKTNIIVRKYGVRTRRSDVEMRPLPLDDDDEDETVFDVGNLNRS